MQYIIFAFRIRNVKYNKVEFKKLPKNGTICVNTIYYEESSRIDKYNPPPNYGSILYGIKNHCYLGNQEELKKENFTTHKYENEYAYKVFKANQEELKMLQKQLLIECGIGMKLDDEDESGFVLFGLHIEKALQLIIFHPFM